MKELCEKYPALEILEGLVNLLSAMRNSGKFNVTLEKEVFYKQFKANISCIGLNPEEYETCIQWFCEIMEY